MKLRIFAVLLAAGSLVAACGKKAEEPASPPTAPATTAPPAATDAPPTEPPPPAVEADTAAPAAAAADTEAPAAAAAEEWLVWSPTAEDGWTTRWISVSGDEFTVVAERKAVVLSDGEKLFRVERHDATVDVSPCVCFEEENSPDCKVIGKVTRPGLRSFDLAGGDAVDIYPAGTEGMVGSDMDLGVDVVGGSGATLFFQWTEGGYFCGAHGSWESGTRVWDVSKGEQVAAAFDEVDKKLPEAVRRPAMKELYQQLKECSDDAEELTEEKALEAMGLGGVSVSVDDAGEPRLSWSFSAEVMYACSADYGVHGSSTSKLIPEAAGLGLAGPLPAGVVKALAAAPKKATAGWAKLTLTGEARDAALAAFKAAPETAWGKTHFSETLTEGAAPTGDAGNAATLVSEARKLTAAKDYPAAIAKFTDAIAIDKTLAAAFSGRGYAELRAKELDAAVGDFTMALTLDKDPKYQAQVYFNLGQVAELQKDKAAAKAAYEKSIGLRANDAVQKALDRVSK